MMTERHFQFWPKRLPTTLTIPETTIYDNLEVSARRYPQKTAIHYYGNTISYRKLCDEANALAGYLQTELGVAKGDRVVLYMQNSPQYIVAFYAILRANAVVVPINPMNTTDELAFYVTDCGAKVAIIGQELYERIAPVLQKGVLKHLIVAAYSDYLPGTVEYELPEAVAAARRDIDNTAVTSWNEALAGGYRPGPIEAGADDLAVLPYTSGTTGKPKGCIHTHRTVQANIVGSCAWYQLTPNATILATLPLFHVTGLQHSMNAPIYAGSTIVLLTRWHRNVAAQLIERAKCTHWTNIATMVVDFLANPNLSKYRLHSMCLIGGGGAPLPKAVGEKLYQLTGIRYVEGYGLSETMAQTHFNPPDRPKMQCVGVPSFDVDARVVDPETLRELGPGEEGEIVVRGPQVFKGYWNRPEENNKAFVEIDGKTFFRTGDIGKYDEEGYFFIIDRLKRMINAAGFKVWPAEVESILYKHPAVEHACVIGAPDDRRGETVKAFIVLKETAVGTVTEKDIIDWSKGQMAEYKYPRIVEIVRALPMSGSGKILWRVLQEAELKKQKQA